MEQLEQEEPRVWFLHGKTARTLAAQYGPPPPTLPGVCGEWHYGPSGAGKTTAVRTAHPDAYIKPRTKWWDGYRPEDPKHAVVIMDDVDPFCGPGLTGLIKDWGDKWTFQAEIKGGSMTIRPTKMIITSQYHPNQIWKDAESLDAILRRYKMFPHGDVTGMDVPQADLGDFGPGRPRYQTNATDYPPYG